MIHEDTRITTLNKWQLAAYESASRLYAEEGIAAKCSATYARGHKTRRRPIAGERCWSPAGKGTDHVGYGRCVAHGGAKKEGRAEAGWMMAHRFAEELDVSPWEALLMVIRITAGRLRYIEAVLATAENDAQLEGRESQQEEVVGGALDGAVNERNLSWWVDKSEVERAALAKYSKAAIDAGVAQLLIEKELRAGRDLAQRYVGVMEQLKDAGLDEASLAIARNVLRQDLQLAIESS